MDNEIQLAKDSNIILDPKIKRLVEYSEDSKQINILDTRFYKRNDKFYPSVTSVLNYFPKNQYFYGWLKDVGHNAEIIANKAASEGTAVHKAAEKLLKGETINWIDDRGNVIYNLLTWKMILRFADFWNMYKPELIAIEYHLFSDEHEYAGTGDIVCRFEDKVWLLDIKTSNYLHTSYDLQLAAYANAWNETHNEPITETGIIWLKAHTRGVDGQGKKMQGKGWQIKHVSDIERNFEMFKKIYEIYKLENPNMKPHSEILPTTIKLTQ
jgi:hypothetical protein